LARLHRKPGKTGFRGAEEHARLKARAFKIFGLLEADGPAVWATSLRRWQKVGVITCPCYSKLTKKSMAIMRVDVACAKQGTKLEVRGKTLKAKAIAHTISFDDPEKKKRNAVG
jgi:aminomethyltransferase